GFEMDFDPETSEIIVRWNPRLPGARKGGSTAARDDKLMLAVYDVEDRQAYGEVYGASRKAGIEKVQVPAGLVATYHVYVAFVAADHSSRSDSLYLGTVSVGTKRKSDSKVRG